MAEKSSIGLDQIQESLLCCPICLDLYKDPVTTFCGHSFCRACLQSCWKHSCWNKAGKLKLVCPLCKSWAFSSPGSLQVNHVLRDIVVKFQQTARDGDVACDLCLGSRRKAVQSCLVCMITYCQEHVVLHNAMFSKRNHKLTEPVANLKDCMCQRHEQPLQRFCVPHKTFICLMCRDHQGQGHCIIEKWKF